MNRVSENIKKIREEAKMPAKQLAKKMGVSESFILEVEQGRKVLSESLIQRFSKILGKNVQDMGLSSLETAAAQEDKIKKERTERKRIQQKEKPREIKTEAPVNDVWNQAFGENLKNIPVFTSEMRIPVDQVLYPVTGGKIENHPQEKITVIRTTDNSMSGYGMPEGSDLMGNLTREAIEEGFYLIETDERKIRHVRNLGNGNLLIKRKEDTEFSETRPQKEVKVFVKFFMVKRFI